MKAIAKWQRSRSLSCALRACKQRICVVLRSFRDDTQLKRSKWTCSVAQLEVKVAVCQRKGNISAVHLLSAKSAQAREPVPHMCREIQRVFKTTYGEAPTDNEKNEEQQGGPGKERNQARLSVLKKVHVTDESERGNLSQFARRETVDNFGHRTAGRLNHLGSEPLHFFQLRAELQQ